MSVRIPPPPTVADGAMNTWLNDLYRELNRLEGETRKLQKDLEVARTNRFILCDEVGARYAILVNSVGPVVEATLLP